MNSLFADLWTISALREPGLMSARHLGPEFRLASVCVCKCRCMHSLCAREMNTDLREPTCTCWCRSSFVTLHPLWTHKDYDFRGLSRHKIKLLSNCWCITVWKLSVACVCPRLDGAAVKRPWLCSGRCGRALEKLRPWGEWYLNAALAVAVATWMNLPDLSLSYFRVIFSSHGIVRIQALPQRPPLTHFTRSYLSFPLCRWPQQYAFSQMASSFPAAFLWEALRA